MHLAALRLRPDLARTWNWRRQHAVQQVEWRGVVLRMWNQPSHSDSSAASAVRRVAELSAGLVGPLITQLTTSPGAKSMPDKWRPTACASSQRPFHSART